MTEVKSSGADPPAAMKVAPATSSEQPITSMMTSSAGTKNWADGRGGIQQRRLSLCICILVHSFKFTLIFLNSVSEHWKLTVSF